MVQRIPILLTNNVDDLSLLIQELLLTLGAVPSYTLSSTAWSPMEARIFLDAFELLVQLCLVLIRSSCWIPGSIQIRTQWTLTTSQSSCTLNPQTLIESTLFSLADDLTLGHSLLLIPMPSKPSIERVVMLRFYMIDLGTWLCRVEKQGCL